MIRWMCTLKWHWTAFRINTTICTITVESNTPLTFLIMILPLYIIVYFVQHCLYLLLDKAMDFWPKLHFVFGVEYILTNVEERKVTFYLVWRKWTYVYILLYTQVFTNPRLRRRPGLNPDRRNLEILYYNELVSSVSCILLSLWSVYARSLPSALEYLKL